jgi:hypothetical protein
MFFNLLGFWNLAMQHDPPYSGFAAHPLLSGFADVGPGKSNNGHRGAG